METIKRLLEIELPKRQSAFLWGPRKTGKTTYLRDSFPDSLTYDVLQTDLFLESSSGMRCLSRSRSSPMASRVLPASG